MYNGFLADRQIARQAGREISSNQIGLDEIVLVGRIDNV